MRQRQNICNLVIRQEQLQKEQDKRQANRGRVAIPIAALSVLIEQSGWSLSAPDTYGLMAYHLGP